MITIRKARARGHANFGWLDSHHSFSFGKYQDPNFMGFGSLRVINDDRVEGGGGFSPHPHADMEIISYVLDGALAHEDSIGTGSLIKPGDVQRMSAGRGIRHSEFNASKTEPVHFLQIWIIPDVRGIEPSYEQKTFSADDKRGRMTLVASRGGRDGTVTIHQDVDLYAGIIGPGDKVDHAFKSGRKAWLQLARGSVMLNGEILKAGDGAAIEGEAAVTLQGGASDAEVLLFDLAA